MKLTRGIQMITENRMNVKNRTIMYNPSQKHKILSKKNVGWKSCCHSEGMILLTWGRKINRRVYTERKLIRLTCYLGITPKAISWKYLLHFTLFLGNCVKALVFLRSLCYHKELLKVIHNVGNLEIFFQASYIQRKIGKIIKDLGYFCNSYNTKIQKYIQKINYP